jgi:hypothetical protein
VSRPEPGNLSRTPETYLGSNRANADDGPIARGTGTPIDYAPAGAPRNGQWALSGRWTIAAEYVVPEASGSLQLGFDAKDVFLVIEPEERGAAITVTVDGVAPADTADVRRGILVPSESRMYHLVGLPSAGAHVLTLAVTGRVRLFAFTFG